MRAKLLASVAAALILNTVPLAAVFADPSSSATDKTATGQNLPGITTKDLKAKLDKHEPVTLVEALESKYYDKWHLPGAVRMTEPEKDAARLLPNKKAEIVVYCMNVY